jgi:hypothetical protein
MSKCKNRVKKNNSVPHDAVFQNRARCNGLKIFRKSLLYMEKDANKPNVIDIKYASMYMVEKYVPNLLLSKSAFN